MSSVEEGTRIPVIDLSAFLAGEGSQETVDSIRDACENVGFFQVVGHGVPSGPLTRIAETIKQVAALPERERKTLSSPTKHPFRGLRTYLNDDGDIEVVRLQVSHFDDAADARAAGVSGEYADFYEPNVWPEQIPGIREDWQTCFSATRALGKKIMALFALALDLPEDYFDPFLELDSSTFSANLYPGQSTLSEPGEPKVIFPAHSDSGMLTVLYQTGNYTGLQVLAKDNSWIDVPIVPGSFVINIGDLMTRWTNGQWISTTHRVIASTDETGSRVSIPTFYLPAVETTIAPLESCVPQGSVPAYSPTTPYEWEGEFLERSKERYRNVV